MPAPRIKRDPKVMMGKPVIAGTRITVELILRFVDREAGASDAEVLRAAKTAACVLNYP